MSETAPSKAPELELLKEHKLYELLPGSSPEDRFEAYSVCRAGDHYFVIFEDTPHIARMHISLSPSHRENIIFRQLAERQFYEDITFDRRSGRFLVISKAEKKVNGRLYPRISEYSTDLQFLDRDLVDFPVNGKDGKLSAFHMVRRKKQEYVLGLCAQNHCMGGRKRQIPGNGRIQIFVNEGNNWSQKNTIKLPESAAFKAYTALSVRSGRIAVASQNDSAVWIGQFQDGSWDFVDHGIVYVFPKSKKGNTVYSTVEGLDWSDDDELVIVSGRRTRGQPKRSRKKDQSIHLFRVPLIVG